MLRLSFFSFFPARRKVLILDPSLLFSMPSKLNELIRLNPICNLDWKKSKTRGKKVVLFPEFVT